MLSTQLTTVTVLALAMVSMAAPFERRESLAAMKTDEKKLQQELTALQGQEKTREKKIAFKQDTRKDLSQAKDKLEKLEESSGNRSAKQALRKEIKDDRSKLHPRETIKELHRDERHAEHKLENLGAGHHAEKQALRNEIKHDEHVIDRKRPRSLEIRETLAAMKTDEKKLQKELTALQGQEKTREKKIAFKQDTRKDLAKSRAELERLSEQTGGHNRAAKQALRKEIQSDKSKLIARDLEFEELFERDLEVRESLAAMRTDEKKLQKELTALQGQEKNREKKIAFKQDTRKDLAKSRAELEKLEESSGNRSAKQALRKEIQSDKSKLIARDLEFEELLERNLDLEEELLSRDMDFDDLFERDFEFDELD